MIHVLKMNPSKSKVQGKASATSVVGFAGDGGMSPPAQPICKLHIL